MRKRYEESFKRQAVELAESLGNVLEAARQLGISDINIHGWKKKYGTCLQPNELEELKRLRRENAELKKVNHILKSAAAFFFTRPPEMRFKLIKTSKWLLFMVNST